MEFVKAKLLPSSLLGDGIALYFTQPWYHHLTHSYHCLENKVLGNFQYVAYQLQHMKSSGTLSSLVFISDDYLIIYVKRAVCFLPSNDIKILLFVRFLVW